MDNWKGLQFRDTSGAEFELTHKTGKKSLYTVLITKAPPEGALTIANPTMRLSENEFVMSQAAFDGYLKSGTIYLI